MTRKITDPGSFVGDGRSWGSRLSCWCRSGFGATATVHSEITGGVTNTWSNYVHASGTAGQIIPNQTKVMVSCRVNGFKVADGNTWWYRIASKPWANKFYASADAFYNNGTSGGPLKGTPYYDVSVPICAGSVGPYAETTGGVTHTWSDYADAGGTQGPTIASNKTVEIKCAVVGFKVADGNTWWYRIASAPWKNNYYASADAFYNNGVTSGSLIGTPWVDPRSRSAPPKWGRGARGSFSGRPRPDLFVGPKGFLQVVALGPNDS